ncbi:MAG: Rap1a/Tai family immunity protein [Aestuariivirga sp.]
MVSQPHLVTVVLQWLDAHKDGKNTEAHKVVGAALQEAYPCKK